MYSRMSGDVVKRNLAKLGVDFFILEDSWCTRRTRYSFKRHGFTVFPTKYTRYRLETKMNILIGTLSVVQAWVQHARDLGY